MDTIQKIEFYTAVGQEVFMVTSHWQDATIRQLEIIGEAVKRLPSKYEILHSAPLRSE